jgi:hypothetical protein
MREGAKLRKSWTKEVSLSMSDPRPMEIVYLTRSGQRPPGRENILIKDTNAKCCTTGRNFAGCPPNLLRKALNASPTLYISDSFARLYFILRRIDSSSATFNRFLGQGNAFQEGKHDKSTTQQQPHSTTSRYPIAHSKRRTPRLDRLRVSVSAAKY